jgi:hypothetical protein
MNLIKSLPLPPKKRNLNMNSEDQLKRLAKSYQRLMEECQHIKIYSIQQKNAN